MPNTLNPQQLEAVKWTQSPLLVLAGAGSGKTGVISEKIAYLIDQLGMPAEKIRAVTFTNKSAREMKQRVAQRMSADKIKHLKISTFHTLGLDILRRHYKDLGLRKGFSIMDGQDCHDVLQSIKLDHKLLSETLDSARWKISAWKNDNISPELALGYAKDDETLNHARLYLTYQQQLRAYNSVDFDDLIALPVELFTQHPDILERWRQQLHYLLVDEYQDTNESQYQLINLLVGPRDGLTVVGDDDQSIYAWRGAKPENIDTLHDDYPRLKVIKLEQNYRSCANILMAANNLIDINPHKVKKRLWSDLGQGDAIKILECADSEDEAQRVVTEIVHRHIQQRVPYDDFAILYRGNHQARPFEKALREHQVSYKITGGTAFFERAEVKDVLSYLRLIANLDDDRAFLRVVNTPSREIGTSTLEKLGNHAQTRQKSLYDCCWELSLKETLQTAAYHRLLRFAEWASGWVDNVDDENPIQTVKDIIHDVGYEPWLQNTSPDPKTAERRMENVHELIEWMQNMYVKAGKEDSFAEIVTKISLMGILERDKEEADNQQGVQLITLHGAKGLEYRHVYLVGMEEELLPHRTSIEEDNIEEERRLAYVGMTRAMRSLTFTHAQVRYRYGENIICERSRFLEEIGDEHLNTNGNNTPAKSRAEELADGKNTLAGLKALLQG